MRVALFIAASFIASIGVLTKPSQGSTSCMSQSEARQHFGSVHLYWHGPDHCWDATPTTRRRHVARARVERQTALRKLQKEQPPNWREARSEMVAAAGPSGFGSELNDAPDTTMTRAT